MRNHMMKHSTTTIIAPDGNSVSAAAPVIISASRATDLPAFYARWFFKRLDEGYVRWSNPFSGKGSYVSFEKTRFIVFWSKNPQPLLQFLPQLQRRGLGFYMQFTLNDYEREGLEPHVPALSGRIDTFKRIIDDYGEGHAVWRFDPLLLTDDMDTDTLLAKISNIAEQLKGYTDKLVFSFADIAAYRKVGRNLSANGVHYQEWDEMHMLQFAEKLSKLHMGLKLATCSEAIDLGKHGISHNSCIDPELIAKLSPGDAALQNFLYGAKRDSGQRPHCGCILSKDIGAYNTCPHGCLYCYANTSPTQAANRYQKIRTNLTSDSLIE